MTTDTGKLRCSETNTTDGKQCHRRGYRWGQLAGAILCVQHSAARMAAQA